MGTPDERAPIITLIRSAAGIQATSFGRPVAALAAVVLLAAGCGGANDDGHPGPATPTTREAAEAEGSNAVLADVRELLDSTIGVVDRYFGPPASAGATGQG